MPSKSERRALGREAARKRAAARRRRELREKVLNVAAPIAVIGLIVLAVWFFNRPDHPNTPAASGPSWLPAGMDQQLATKPTVTAGTGTVSELKATPLITGTGATVKAGDTITVNYVGVQYSTGTEFDSSWKTGAPMSFPIGVGQVIQGWDQGLVGQTVGSRVQLDIPQALAYPTKTDGPTSGDLRFVVDILGTAASGS